MMKRIDRIPVPLNLDNSIATTGNRQEVSWRDALSPPAVLKSLLRLCKYQAFHILPLVCSIPVALHPFEAG